jgi:hypothetical protein
MNKFAMVDLQFFCYCLRPNLRFSWELVPIRESQKLIKEPP